MKNIEVVAAATIENGKVLITQRVDGDFRGLWEFPGGKIENNETHEEALTREIQEELNCTINNLHYLTSISYQYPTFHLTMHVYTCSLKDGKPELSVHSALQWVSKEKLETIEWVPADIDVVNKLYDYMSSLVK